VSCESEKLIATNFTEDQMQTSNATIVRWNWLWMVGLFACSGAVAPADGKGGSAGTSGIVGSGLGRLDSKQLEICRDKRREVSPGAPVARRLNRREYDNAIEALLFDRSNPSKNFPADESEHHFDTMSDALTVQEAHLRAYLDVSSRIAKTAVAEHLGEIAPCDLRADAKGCKDRFIDSFGMRAYRRPLDSEERALLAGVFEQGIKTSPDRAAELVIQTAIQSAPFLYRFESRSPADGSGGNTVRVDGWNMASRLSFLLWSSIPDEALLAAAKAGDLDSTEGIAREVARMLADPKASRTTGDFHEQWLGLLSTAVDKDVGRFASWTPNSYSEMRQEVRMFTNDVVFGKGSFKDLMTGSHSFVNTNLATHYGLADKPADWQRVEFEPETRAGVLTLGGVLSRFAHKLDASPVRRGVFIRDHLFCDPPPPPLPNVDTSPPPQDPNKTTRERFAQLTENAVCANCHRLINPIGFGLSNYDAAGRYSRDENGIAIDASGSLEELDFEMPEYNGPRELGERIAGSKQAQRCVVSNWFRFAFGRVESDGDLCALQRLDEVMSSPNGSLRDLIVALTEIETFQFRTVEAP
jgi:Protein of unknown function (DUF1592)/Protein of unknown function (DUF1588)/Protein of unknown function (DUF1587)/Protein of unknown function (DUF1585)/Protein of unknown function (DUF1595)